MEEATAAQQDADIARRGCTASEAALVWAMAHFGGGDDLLARLDVDVADEVRAQLEALEALEDDDARTGQLQAWRLHDRHSGDVRVFWRQVPPSWHHAIGQRLGARWSRALQRGPEAAPYALALRPFQLHWAGPSPRLLAEPTRFELRRVVELEPGAQHLLFELIGLYQLAEITRTAGRRHTARLLRDLDGWHREELRRFLARDRQLGDEERTRLNEVFIALSRQHGDDMGVLVLHLGLCVVAIAAGRRFGEAIRRVASRLAPVHGEALLRYWTANIDTTRRASCLATRRALDVLVAEGILSAQLTIATAGGQP